MEYQDVLKFWFEELAPEDWFSVNEDVDNEIRKRFRYVHHETAHGEHADWRTTPEGTLAEVLVLDQFSRNMFRGKPESFGYDAQALEIAREAVDKGFDEKLQLQQRAFLYMPYMHSELREVHEQALELYTKLGNEINLKYEKRHKRIIDRFGRYPHRNEILGREMTSEEQEFLENDEHASF